MNNEPSRLGELQRKPCDTTLILNAVTLTARGPVMPHPDVPNKGVIQSQILFTQQGDGREIGDAGYGNHKGEDLAEPGWVDGDRILGGFRAAVSEDVHQLQGFGAPEHHGGMDGEQTEGNGAP